MWLNMYRKLHKKTIVQTHRQLTVASSSWGAPFVFDWYDFSDNFFYINLLTIVLIHFILDTTLNLKLPLKNLPYKILSKPFYIPFVCKNGIFTAFIVTRLTHCWLFYYCLQEFKWVFLRPCVIFRIYHGKYRSRCCDYPNGLLIICKMH